MLLGSPSRDTSRSFAAILLATCPWPPARSWETAASRLERTFGREIFVLCTSLGVTQRTRGNAEGDGLDDHKRCEKRHVEYDA